MLIGASSAQALPTVTTGLAMPTASGTTLNAVIATGGHATQYGFQYGSTTSYDHETAIAVVAGGQGTVSVTGTVSGLSPGTYHYRVVAADSSGSSYYAVAVAVGDDATFTTTSGPSHETISIPKARTFRSKNGTVSISVKCATANTSNCTGTTSLSTINGTTAATGKKAKRTTIGSASFNIRPGSTRTVKLKLNRSGRSFLARHKTIRATLTIKSAKGETLKSTAVKITR